MGKLLSPDDVPEGWGRTRYFSKERVQVRHGEGGCEVETFATIGRIRRICDRINEPMANVALAWLLNQRGVVSVLAGARKPEQVTENVRATALELPPGVASEPTEATYDLKLKLGPNPDMRQSKSRYR